MATQKLFDSLGFIMEYEGGAPDEAAIAKGFQGLIDNGMAWRLQGSYGRMAAHLIRSGHCVDTYGVCGILPPSLPDGTQLHDVRRK